MIRSSKKTQKRNRMIKALDAACRLRVVIERDENICQRCGKENGSSHEDGYPVIIQWCHVHTREYHITRWEDDNSFAGCSKCHVWFDNHKVMSFDWFRKNWPERWERLQTLLQSNCKTGTTFVRDLHQELRSEK